MTVSVRGLWWALALLAAAVLAAPMSAQSGMELHGMVSHGGNDDVSVTAGGSVMHVDDQTFFGQPSEATSVYLRGRYSS